MGVTVEPGAEGELGPADKDEPEVGVASTYEEDGVDEGYSAEEDAPGVGATIDEFPAGVDGAAGKEV